MEQVGKLFKQNQELREQLAVANDERDQWERNCRGAAADRIAAWGKLDAAKIDMILLREDVAAANGRAETAERLVETRRRLQAASDRQHDKAMAVAEAKADELIGHLRARLDGPGEAKPLRTEWSTANTYAHPDDDIVNRALAMSNDRHPTEIYTGMLSRQLYAGPWLAA